MKNLFKTKKKVTEKDPLPGIGKGNKPNPFKEKLDKVKALNEKDLDGDPIDKELDRISKEIEGGETAAQRFKNSSKKEGIKNPFQVGDSGKKISISNEESIDMDITPKKAIKRRGRKNKSVNVYLPAKNMIVFIHGFFVGGVCLLFKLDSDEFDLDDDELGSMEPLMELVISKYLKDASPEALLAIIYFTTLMSKTASAIARKKSKMRLKKLNKNSDPNAR